MKKGDVVKTIDWMIRSTDPDEREDVPLRILSYLEDIGMLPPPSTCKLEPDNNRPGTMKHSESKREWDDETK